MRLLPKMYKNETLKWTSPEDSTAYVISICNSEVLYFEVNILDLAMRIMIRGHLDS